MIDWTEKYRPKGLGDVIGNSEAVNKLRSWADSWRTRVPKKHKAVVLIGDPGIGKTTSAHALAADYGWQVVELNASDKRNADAIKEIATMGALGETFTDTGEFLKSDEGRKKLIILDEADNIFGTEDKGGVRAISSLVQETKQPVLLIVNDFYALKRRSSVITKDVLSIQFRKPQPATIAKLLRKIAASEKTEIGPEALRAISKNANGDIRAAVNDLQSLVEGRTNVTESDVLVLGERDQRKNIFQSLAVIFRTSNCQRSRRALFELDEDPSHTILWVDQNIPISYSKIGDRLRAFEVLAKADRFLGRVRIRRHYGLWGYASDLMSCGVSLAKRREYRGFVNYQFPVWLSMMSKSKDLRDTRNQLGLKLGGLTHTSKVYALQEQLPYFRKLYANDREFCLTMTESLSLDEEEVAFLLNQKVDSHPVRHIFDDLRKKKMPATVKQQERAKQETYDEKSEDDSSQKSLFEF